MTLLTEAWRRIESVTSHMTMYRLVLNCLATLAALSFVFSVVGFVSYAPLAILVSLLVPLATSYLSNRLISRIYQVTPHSESSLITGYLIFFIFPPSTEALALLGLALAAVFASGSKYLLAYRGRHIFNPAAVGAFTLTLFNIYFSGWWIGTPALLPFTLISAGLILHRTRRLPMAAMFIAVSGGIMVVRSIVAGLPLTTALVWPLTSSPMIFFAGLMLSEPLTQPPLRWQQLTMAGVVGALFSIPLHVGAVYVAPESALLIGNAMAFAFGQRKGIELILHRTNQLTPTTVEFSFTPTRRLKFRPGQYLELTIPHKGADDRGLRRVFSISSAPSDTGAISIGTKIPTESSTFKRALVELAQGSTVRATSIAGDFTLPRDTDTPLLLIAGGIGITPFASQLAEGTDHRNTVLVYSVNGPSEISYRPVLEKSGINVILVSRETITGLPPHWTSITATRVNEDLLRAAVPDIEDRHVYISGPPSMVSGVGTAAHRLNAASVRTDFFSGY